jgi:hypothetical protein
MLVLNGKSAGIPWGVLGNIKQLPFCTTFWVTLSLAFLERIMIP